MLHEGERFIQESSIVDQNRSDQLIARLPHREPMLWVDRVTELEHNQITIERTVNPDDLGENTALPQTLLLEILAQAGAVLALEQFPQYRDRGVIFTGISSATYNLDTSPITSGNILAARVRIRAERRGIIQFTGELKRQSDTLLEAEFSGAAIPPTQT